MKLIQCTIFRIFCQHISLHFLSTQIGIVSMARAIIRYLGPIVFFFLTSQITVSQESRPILLKKITTPIVLDGVSDEEAWESVDSFPLTTYTPTYGVPPSEKTEIRIAYDDNYLYLSARCFDSDSSLIQGNSLIRDMDRGGDFVNFLIDSFNDKRNMSVFMTTPTGNRLDAEVINDAEGIDFWNMGWNAIWESAVSLNSDGWFAEMRIPFSSLGFSTVGNRVTFGIIVQRLINRKNERLVFPDIFPAKIFSAWKPSFAQEVVLDNIERSEPVLLSPYLVARHQNAFDEALPPSPQFSNDIGLDMKYAFAPNMTFDLSVNTDFAQVEVDNEQVNLTRFSLFYPERRQFFQERSGVFDFTYATNNRLFHSRTIGITETGRPVRILGGLRFVGRINDWDIGLLNMQTEGQSPLASENFGVLRLLKQMGGESRVGTLVTSRIGSDGRRNIVWGLDGIFHVRDLDYVSLKVAEVFTNEDTAPSIRTTMLFGQWERRTSVGFGFNISGMVAGDRFQPAMGYHNRSGVVGSAANALYGIQLSDGSIRKHTLELNVETWNHLRDGSFESWKVAGKWLTDFTSGTSVALGGFHAFENLSVDLPLTPELTVSARRYSNNGLNLLYALSPGYQLRATLGIEFGSFYGGSKWSAQFSPTWNLSRYLELGSDVIFDLIDFPDRGEHLEAKVLRFRLVGALTPSFSAMAFTQFNSIAQLLSSNIRLRYNFSEGTDLFLVYNPSYSTAGGSLFSTSFAQSIVLKYIHLFNL